MTADTTTPARPYPLRAVVRPHAWARWRERVRDRGDCRAAFFACFNAATPPDPGLLPVLTARCRVRNRRRPDGRSKGRSKNPQSFLVHKGAGVVFVLEHLPFARQRDGVPTAVVITVLPLAMFRPASPTKGNP